MQIWTPTQQPRQDGEFAVHLNPGNGEPFAVIALSRDGQSALTMESAADCDRLVRAAVQAKSLLLGETSESVRVPAVPQPPTSGLVPAEDATITPGTDAS